MIRSRSSVGCVLAAVASLAHAGGAFPLKIVDDMGRTVQFTQPPQRIVSCYGGFTEMVFMLGAGDRLVGATRACNHPEAARAIPRIGTHLKPSTEKVVALRPDLLLAMVGSTGKERFLAFESFGIKVLVFAPKDLDGVFSVMSRLAEVLGGEREAVSAIAGLRRRTADVTKAVEGRPRVKVLAEAAYQPFMASGRWGVTNDLIRLAGGVNVVEANKKLVKVGLEEVVAADPDVYIVERGPMNRYAGDPLERKGFDVLKPFREKRVLIIDYYHVKRAGPRLMDGLEELARCLHPEAFAD